MTTWKGPVEAVFAASRQGRAVAMVGFPYATLFGGGEKRLRQLSFVRGMADPIYARQDAFCSGAVPALVWFPAFDPHFAPRPPRSGFVAPHSPRGHQEEL